MALRQHLSVFRQNKILHPKIWQYVNIIDVINTESPSPHQEAKVMLFSELTKLFFLF